MIHKESTLEEASTGVWTTHMNCSKQIIFVSNLIALMQLQIVNFIPLNNRNIRKGKEKQQN